MTNQEHLNKLNEGVAAWNQWYTEHTYIRPDLNGADLSGADLSGADLSSTSLRDADLIDAHLSFAHLRGADLSGANLIGTDLRTADLSGADLSGADLSGADLTGAHLTGAHLSDALCWDTIFANVDLQTVKGLESVIHKGPSILNLHNTYLPQDGSALPFLRGAGLPDEWIAFYHTTMMHPIRYHFCFISYSSTDDLLAHRLHADLQDHGVRCWFAPEEMKSGDTIRAGIDEAIQLQDKLLLLLSEHSLASSWVEEEVKAAIEKSSASTGTCSFPSAWMPV